MGGRRRPGAPAGPGQPRQNRKSPFFRAASCQSLDAFFRERIFAPLQMASTGLQVPAGAAARLTTNYDVTPTGIVPGDARESSVWLKPPTLPAGGGGLVSTAHDFARFSRMVTDAGSLARAA